MKKIIFYLPLALLISCTGTNKKEVETTNKIDYSNHRVIKLGKDLVDYAMKSKECCVGKPSDISSIGEALFWSLKTIKLKEKTIEYALNIKNSKDKLKTNYELTITGRDIIKLNLFYDSNKDVFDVRSTSFLDKNQKKRKNKFNYFNKNNNQRTIIPGVGVYGFIIGETHQSEIYTTTKDENFYKDLDMDFRFNQNGILDKIMIFNNIRTQTESGIKIFDKSEKVKRILGNPNSFGLSLDFGNNEVCRVNSLNYNGISFILVNDFINMILIENIR